MKKLLSVCLLFNFLPVSANNIGACTSRTPFALDICSGARTVEMGSAQVLSYDSKWQCPTATGMRLFVNGEVIGDVNGADVLSWTPQRSGEYALELRSYVDDVLCDEVLTAVFDVRGVDIVNAEVRFDEAPILYDGTAREPHPVVVCEGKTLVEGVDYDLRWENNVDAGIGKVVITGKGDYSDEIEKSFTIVPAGICSLDICSGVRFPNCPEKLNFDQTWIGAEGGDKYIRIMENGARITQETGVGDYAWTANDKGLYTLEYRTYIDGYKQDEVYTAQFFIGGGALTQDDISVSITPEAFAYDGQPKEPAVAVFFDGVALRKDVDYIVSYKDNVEIGTGYVVVRGIGEYTEEVRKPFTIYGPMGVRALSARQRYPWNGLVDIDCIADGEPGSTYRVSFSAFDVVGGTNLPMRTVWQTGGETNVCHQVTPQNYRFVWDAGADLPDGIKFDNIKIVASASELWSNELTFSVSGYTGSSTLSGVPVLVRLSSTLAGFDYSRMAYQGSGYDLSFVSADGKTIYPHEIDTWNPSGESLVWVRLPSVAKTDTIFKMRYGNPLAPSVNAQSVWSDYAGVWHLSESTSPAKDSTSHALNATTSGSLYASGACGTGRSTEVKVPNYNSLALGGTFTASGWFRSAAAITTYPKAFYRNESGWTAGGWGVEFATSATSINIVGASNTSYLKHVTVPTVVNSWVYLTFVYNGTTATCYANGASVQSGTIVAAKDNGKALSVGSGGLLSDEVRLRKGTLTADRIKADYNIVANKSFLSASAPVSRDSVVAESDPIRIDLKQDAVRESEGIEPLVYSGLWYEDNNATVTIAQDGVALFEGLDGAGVKSWSVNRNGRYELTHTTYTNGIAGKVESAVFVVEGMDEPICPEGEEPGTGEVPEGGISKFDATYLYDGEGHTINTQALYAVTLTGSTPSFSFSLDGETGWQNDPFVYTNVGEYVMWYKIAAPGYIDFKHQAKLVILEAPKIGNAVARQRYPWNGLVDVDFDLSCELETAQILLTLIVHDIIGGTNLPCRTLWVDGAEAEQIQVQSGHHRVTWDADADLPDGFECNRVTVEVKSEWSAREEWSIMKRLKRVMCCLAAVMAVPMLFAAEPTISLTATPRYPWNGLVDLAFTIGADETEGGYAAHQPGDDAIAGYRLKYVQSAGDAQLNTGVVPGSKNTIELKFAFDGTPASQNQCLYCARGATTASYTCFLLEGRWRFDYNSASGTESATPTPVSGVPMVIRTVAGSARVDGVAVQSYTAANFTVGGPLALFSSYVEAPGTRLGNYLKGKIYYLKIFGDDGTTLMHDFVPWEKNGVVGMYDMIAARFVAPNVGTLTCGTRGPKYDTSFSVQDVIGGTNLMLKTVYKSPGVKANVDLEKLVFGTYNWFWDAPADVGDDFVSENVVVDVKVGNAVTYTVKFNANGGTGSMANETFESGIAKALTANSFTRTGFAFQGWATSASGSVKYSNKQSVTDLATTAGTTVNLYAVWKASGGVQLWANGPYWSTYNVGTTKPEGYGYYFWWGGTVGYKRNSAGTGWVSVNDGKSFSFSTGNCGAYNKSASQLKSAGYIDSAGNLVAAHDAATANWGAPWRMPTYSEFNALISKCTTTWTTRNGVYGRLVKGKGDYASKSIFLPAGGYAEGSGLRYLTDQGYYWSSTPYPDSSIYAWRLLCQEYYFGWGNYCTRQVGMTIRPVRGSAE